MKTPQSASVLPPAYTVVLVRGKELQTIFAVWSLTTKIGTRKTSQRAPDDPLANSLASGKGRFPPPWTVEQIPGGFKGLMLTVSLSLTSMGVRQKPMLK